MDFLDADEAVGVAVTHRKRHSHSYTGQHTAHLNGAVSFHVIFISRENTQEYRVVPRHRLSTYGRRAFAVAGQMTFNALLDELRDPTVNTTTFKDTFFLELSTRLTH